MVSQLVNPWWFYILLGIVAGLLSGIMGLGSGIILVPTLVLLCGFGQKSAQGMSLAVMVPMAFVGALRYWKIQDVNMSMLIIGLIVCGALVGTLFGTALAARLPNHVLRKIFAAVLIIAAVRMFFNSTKLTQKALGNNSEQQTISSVNNGEIQNESGI